MHEFTSSQNLGLEPVCVSICVWIGGGEGGYHPGFKRRREVVIDQYSNYDFHIRVLKNNFDNLREMMPPYLTLTLAPLLEELKLPRNSHVCLDKNCCYFVYLDIRLLHMIIYYTSK